MKKALHVDRLQLGVCYYPEHWDQSLWADDFRRMRELGLSIIRMGEFAWSVFEPAEGQFSFALFDHALELAHQHGLQVVFGTPTATPPAWLTHKYPEVLNVSREGVRYEHGARRHYTYNSPVYRMLSARIVTQLVEHLQDHPAIVGWQIDNEINCEVNVFYSQADHHAFRLWLRDRYRSLNALNAAWGTVFWNQTYDTWEQVHLTRPAASNGHNPHQSLDEKRFFSESAISFVKMQADIIRRSAPHHWVTTNGLFGHLDSHRMTREALDFISYDSYPNFATIWPDQPMGALHDRAWSWPLSVIRDISPQFCVMEQQSGPNGWTNRLLAPAPRPGQIRLWTYQSIAHGADAVLYFRWRTATMGTEMYWHGINDYHNEPNRRVEEVRRVGAELAKCGDQLAGSAFQASTAILKDYDNEWDGEIDGWHGPLERTSTAAWFTALQHRHIPVDAVFVSADLSLDSLLKYDVLIYSHPAIVAESTAVLLAAYVDQGGRLIVGCRSGLKEPNGHCRMQRLPGPLSALCGVNVEDFTLIGPAASAPALAWADEITARPTTADRSNDILTLISKDATVLARYSEDYYAGAPALVRNQFGRGAVYYYGAAFNVDVVDALIDHCGLRSPADDVLTLPPDIELCIRRHPTTGASFWFLLNFAASARQITSHGTHVDMLTGTSVTGSATLEPYGVMILRM